MTKTINNHVVVHNAVQRAAARSQLFHGAIIDAEGREIPITEDMIQQACSRLDGKASQFYPPELVAASQ